MEFLDSDLKRYMDKVGDGDGMGPDIVKASAHLVAGLSRPEGADFPLSARTIVHRNRNL